MLLCCRYFCLEFSNGMLESWQSTPRLCWSSCARMFPHNYKPASGAAFNWNPTKARPTASSGSLTALAFATFSFENSSTSFHPLLSDIEINMKRKRKSDVHSKVMLKFELPQTHESSVDSKIYTGLLARPYLQNFFVIQVGICCKFEYGHCNFASESEAYLMNIEGRPSEARYVDILLWGTWSDWGGGKSIAYNNNLLSESIV